MNLKKSDSFDFMETTLIASVIFTFTLNLVTNNYIYLFVHFFLTRLNLLNIVYLIIYKLKFLKILNIYLLEAKVNK